MDGEGYIVMKTATLIAVALAFSAAQGCSQRSNTEGGETGPQSAGETEAAEPGEPTTCPILGSRNWKAWVNAEPGDDAEATLVVEGEIDAPTPGYTFSWEPGMADRSAVPMQRLHLTAAPPDGVVAQVITTESVRYEGPAIAQDYRGVAVMCGEELLAEITEVTTAE